MVKGKVWLGIKDPSSQEGERGVEKNYPKFTIP